MLLLCVFVLQVVWCYAETNLIIDKIKKIKPVGANLAKSFVPLTEIPVPLTPLSGRRHLKEDCSETPQPLVVHDGPNIAINADYYVHDDFNTVATVIFPEHIDRKHFQVTTEVPYLTVGPIEAIGYHPSTPKSEHPSECEKIYQEHLDEQYSDETTDYSEESLEMARMPLFPYSQIEGTVYTDLDI